MADIGFDVLGLLTGGSHVSGQFFDGSKAPDGPALNLIDKIRRIVEIRGFLPECEDLDGAVWAGRGSTRMAAALVGQSSIVP